MRVPFFIFALLIVSLLSGCKSYIPPSGRADLSEITSSSMKASFESKPTASFPVGIAAVRIQSSGYESFSTRREGGVYGHGRYSVITMKEVEEDADLQRMAKLPQVSGLISLNTLLLPRELRSDRELREAAARLKAEMLLLYTFETSFHRDDASVALNAITLGLSPTRRIYVRVAATALLIDTRTGFIYEALEANEKREVITNAWESGGSADRARLDAEKKAFKALVKEFERRWPQVVERAGKGA